MSRLISIAKALTWVGVISAALCIICIVILGAANIRYEVMAWFYAALATAFTLLFIAGAIISLAPDPSPRRRNG